MARRLLSRAGWLCYDLCLISGPFGGIAIYSYETREEDLFTRMCAPLLGVVVGGVGGLLPPLGVYWLYVYADGKGVFDDPDDLTSQVKKTIRRWQ